MSEVIQDSQSGIKRDFPEFIPPLLVKELRQGIRTRGFVLFIVLFPLLMSIPFFFYMMLGQSGMDKSVINVFFWIGLVMVFILFNPLRSLYSVDQEKKTRSDELIMLTHVTSSRIILEKWLSYTLQTLLLVMMVLPFFLLRYFLGGVDLLQELSLIGVLFLLSCVLTALGLWVSGMPLVYRVLFGLGIAVLVCAAVPVTVQIIDSSGTSPIVRFLHLLEDKPVLFFAIAIQLVASIYLVCKGLLLLASRWFAAVSDNTSLPLRKLLFKSAAVIWIAFLAGLLVNYVGNSSDSGDFVLLMSVCSICLVVFFLLEIIVPIPCHLIHVKKLEKEGGLTSRFMALFLPGWQSAGLGLLLLAAVFLGIIMTAYYSTVDKPDSGMQLVRAFLLLIANLLFFSIVFQPLYKRVGIHALLCFISAAAVFGLIALVLFEAWRTNMNGILSALPISSFVDIGKSKVASSVLTGNYLFIGLNFLIFILASLPFWIKYRRDKAILRK